MFFGYFNGNDSHLGLYRLLLACFLLGFKFIISNDRMIQRCPRLSNINWKIKVSKQREYTLYMPISCTRHLSRIYSLLYYFYSIIYLSLTIFYILSNYLSDVYFSLYYIYSIISPLLIISLSSLIRLIESFIFIWYYFGYIYVMLKDEITYI